MIEYRILSNIKYHILYFVCKLYDFCVKRWTSINHVMLVVGVILTSDIHYFFMVKYHMIHSKYNITQTDMKTQMYILMFMVINSTTTHHHSSNVIYPCKSRCVSSSSGCCCLQQHQDRGSHLIRCRSSW